MKKTIYFLTALFAITFLLISCEKEKESPDSGEVQLQSRLLQNDLSEQMTEVASILANNLDDQELRGALLTTFEDQCLEEFLLYDVVENSGRASAYWNVLEDRALMNPLITLAFPSYAFRQNESFADHLSRVDYFVLLVDDPDRVDHLPAFTPDGQSMTIGSNFDENLNYCVLKSSEMYVAVNSIDHGSPLGESMPVAIDQFLPQKTIGTYQLYWTIESDLAQMMERSELEELPAERYHYQITACSEQENTEYLDPRDGDGCDEICERDCPPKTKDELHRIKWSSKKALKVYESGFHLPNVELYVHYVIPTFTSATKVDVKVIPKQIVGHWKDMTENWSEALQLELEEWDLEANMGEDWLVTWFERDYWHTVNEKFSIGFSTTGSFEGNEAKATVGYDISIKKKDKCIGSSIVEYCDPALGEGYDYHTYNYLPDGSDGGFWFREHVKNQ
jgi:hypothetical protein